MSQRLAHTPDPTPSRLRQARWELANFEELSEPAAVHFVFVRDARNQIVDLRCTVATATAAHWFRFPHGDMVGRCLSDMVGSLPDERELAEAYLLVARTGAPARHTLLIEGTQLLGSVEHRISRPGQNCVVAQLNIPGMDQRRLGKV